MAITDIEITQDNTVDDCDLLACHSPLIFLIDVTYSGEAPDSVYCRVYWGSDLLSTFKCIYYSDISATERRFMFIADGILRGYMDDFEDIVQSDDTVIVVSNIVRRFRLIFTGEFSGSPNPDVYIRVAHASRQISEDPCMTDIFDNDTDFYIAGANMPVYIYFYNDDYSNALKINDDVINEGAATVLTEDFGSWSGSGYGTYPTGWTLISEAYPPNSATWRVYENPAGSANWILQGNQYDKLYIYHSTELDSTKEYYVKITYTSNDDFNTILLGYKIYMGAAYFHSVQLPDSGGTPTEIYLPVFNSDQGVGAHYFAIGFANTVYGQSIDVQIDQVILYIANSHIGYYRLKVSDLTEDTDYVFKKDDVESGTKTVRVKEFCDDDKYIKYLDHNGQYRFMVFNRFYETRDNPTLLGKGNKVITSILSGQTTEDVVGYKNERKMVLVSTNLDEDELIKLVDIYVSPRVYLYVGSGEDEAKDWIQVRVNASDNLVRSRKRKFNSIEIEITLPEWFNIKMI